jgi:hypothetical protein
MGIHEEMLRALHTVQTGLMAAGALAALYALHRLLQRRESLEAAEADRREYCRERACQPRDPRQLDDGPQTPTSPPPSQP